MSWSRTERSAAARNENYDIFVIIIYFIYFQILHHVCLTLFFLFLFFSAFLFALVLYDRVCR